jgi:hypothetical protein
MAVFYLIILHCFLLKTISQNAEGIKLINPTIKSILDICLSPFAKKKAPAVNRRNVETMESINLNFILSGLV